MKICLLCGREVKQTEAGLRCMSCGIVPVGAVKEKPELQPHNEDDNG